MHHALPRTHVALVELRPRLPRRHGVFEPGAYFRRAPDPGRTALSLVPVMQGEAHAFALGKLEPARGRGAVLVERQGHEGRQHEPESTPRLRHSTSTASSDGCFNR